MATKIRVSFIREMMVAATKKGWTTELRQFAVVSVAGFNGTGIETSTMKAKHPPRTASHKPAKKATIHLLLLNTARVRRKKRRDVNTIAAE
jgi:hypothetical protein